MNEEEMVVCNIGKNLISDFCSLDYSCSMDKIDEELNSISTSIIIPNFGNIKVSTLRDSNNILAAV